MARGGFNLMSDLTLPSFLVLISYLIPPLLSANENVAKYTNSIKVAYFTSPSMTCDYPMLNISKSTDIDRIFWIFPDGTNVYAADAVSPKYWTFSAPDDNPNSEALALYNLTAIDIDEDQFGYYFCVVEFNSASARKPVAIRWGLNVNGADFSDLLETYRQNAIIGGAAAAALLVIVGGGCLFWNWRYSNDDYDDDDEAEGEDLKEQPMVNVAAYVGEGTTPQATSDQEYDNAAYVKEQDDAALVVHM